MSQQKPPITDLSLGLATRKRPSQIPPGACKDGSKNFWLYRDVLASAPGCQRVTNSLLNENALLLDGAPLLRGPINAAGSDVNLSDPTGVSPYTIEAVFRADALPAVIDATSTLPLGTLAYKGSGSAAGAAAGATNVDWAVCLVENGNAGLYLLYYWSEGGALRSRMSSSALGFGTSASHYHIAIVRTAANTINFFAAAAGSTPIALASTGDSPSGVTAINDNAFDLYVGGQPVAVDASGAPALLPKNEAGLFQFRHRGVVQDLRIWKSDRTASLGTYTRQLTTAEATAETNLLAYYPLTGRGANTYFYSSLVGTSGSAANQVPVLALQRRQATWLTSGHVLGNPIGSSTASIDFDGRDQGLDVLNSYLYRAEGFNQFTTTAGILNARPRMCVSFNVTLNKLKTRQMLFHWTHVPDDQFGTNTCRVSSATTASLDNQAMGAGEGWSLFIDTILVGGQYRFRGGISYTNNAGAARFSIVVSTVNLAVATDYTVTLAYDATVPVLGIHVNGTTTTVATTNIDTTRTILVATADDPVGSYRAYWMTFGKPISRVRKRNNAQADPNDVEVEYDFGRCFEGKIRRVCVATAGVQGFSNTVHDAMRNNLITTRDAVSSLGIQILSLWAMDESAGGFLEDIGFLGNSIDFVVDSDHRWGRSGLATTTKAGVDGLFEHRYRTATGEAKRIVACGGGVAYSVDQGTGALTYIRDGLRNDSGNEITTTHFQDSTILCLGGIHENYQLWKDQLYRLSIEPPAGPIPWGLSDQTNPKAALDIGTRKYTFTYYSQHQNKRSAPGPVVTAQIRSKKANVTFGPDAEINQTYPQTIESVQDETFDLRKSSLTVHGFNYVGYYGSSGAKGASDPDWWQSAPGSGGTRVAKEKKLKLSGNLFIKGGNGDGNNASASGQAEDEVTIDQIRQALDAKKADNKCRIEELPNGKMQIVGNFAGARGFLSLSDIHSERTTLSAGGAIDFNLFPATGANTTNNIIGVGYWDSSVFTASAVIGTPGSGISSHGISLPFSTDPQVTHIEIWRTLAGGSQFRLVERLANGTTGYVDTKADSALTGEVLDLNQAAVPPVKNCIDFGGRAIYWGDELAPQRAYISEVGQPWNVPPQNTIDFLDGNTLKLTGSARTENALSFFKNDTTFVLTNTGNADFPFQVETRMRDIGCVASRGIVNVNEVFYYPDEQGFYGYDTSVPRPISHAIDDTWNAVSAAHYEKIVGVHDRQNECIIWFCPTGDSFDASENVINDRAIVWFYGKGQGPDGDVYGWSLLTGIYVKFATTIQDSNEVNRVWLVDPLGYIYLWNSGTNYGVGALTDTTPALAGAPGTFSTSQLTLTQATLASLPDGYKGLPITVVKASTGERATRYCTADTLASPSVITLEPANPLPFTPANTSDFSVIVGAIEMDWISGEISFSGPATMTLMNFMHFQFTPQTTAGTFQVKWISKYGNKATTPVRQSKDVVNSAAELTLGIDMATRGRRFELEFTALGADNPMEVRTFTPTVEMAERGVTGTQAAQ